MPLLVCAALLCGCGGGEKTLAVQEQYRTVRTADMEAEVVSHTATDDRRFVLTCQYDTEGQSITTVKEPQELKGLTAVLVDGQLSLKSNGQLLPAGAATDICPANCLPYLLGALAEGYLTEQGAETLEDVSWFVCSNRRADFLGGDAGGRAVSAHGAGHHRAQRRGGAVRRVAGSGDADPTVCGIFTGRTGGADGQNDGLLLHHGNGGITNGIYT